MDNNYNVIELELMNTQGHLIKHQTLMMQE
jgi:hypothetical protein